MVTGKLIPTQYFPSILSKFPYGVIICNSGGKFIYWNQEAIQILKTTKFDVEQDSWVDEYGIYSTDKARKLTTDELPMSMALKGVVSTKNIYLQNEENPNGVYLKIKGYPVFDDEEGNLKLGVIILEDITAEQKKFDEFLRTINELSDFIRNQISDDQQISDDKRDARFEAQDKLDKLKKKLY